MDRFRAVHDTRMKKPPDGCTWSGKRLTRIPATSRPDLSWSKIWSGMSKASQRRDEEFKETMKKTRGQRWNCPWKQPRLARFENLGTEKPMAKTNPTLANQSMHASYKLTNLREIVWRDLCLKIMKIALQERDSIDWVITILRTTSLLMHQAIIKKKRMRV